MSAPGLPNCSYFSVCGEPGDLVDPSGAYCILHFPGDKDEARFLAVLRAFLERGHSNFSHVCFPGRPSRSSRRVAKNTISYVVVTENSVQHAGPVLDVIAAAKRGDDEVILLTRSDHVGDLSGPPRPWLRVVGIPDGNVFSLRAQLPAVARKDWVLLVEEHSFVTKQTLEAIQDVIARTPGIDLVVFLGKNLTAVSKWSWANFFHTFALAWAPLDGPPPFSPVTAAVVRREAIGTERPLQDGEWELRLLPRIFETGRFAYSNEIYIDHCKPLNALSCFVINFHNARAGAALQRRLGVPRRRILREGHHTRVDRPYALARAIAPRSHQVPAPMLGPLRVIGWAFHLGMIAGALFGPGRSAHKLD